MTTFVTNLTFRNQSRLRTIAAILILPIRSSIWTKIRTSIATKIARIHGWIPRKSTIITTIVPWSIIKPSIAVTIVLRTPLILKITISLLMKLRQLSLRNYPTNWSWTISRRFNTIFTYITITTIEILRRPLRMLSSISRFTLAIHCWHWNS